MKAVVAAFNQEKALVGAFSVITNLRMELGWNFLNHYLGGGAALHQTPHLRAVGVGALVRAGAALRHGDGGELAGGTELRHAGHVVTLSNAQLCAMSNTQLTCW